MIKWTTEVRILFDFQRQANLRRVTCSVGFSVSMDVSGFLSAFRRAAISSHRSERCICAFSFFAYFLDDINPARRLTIGLPRLRLTCHLEGHRALGAIRLAVLESPAASLRIPHTIAFGVPRKLVGKLPKAVLGYVRDGVTVWVVAVAVQIECVAADNHEVRSLSTPR